MPDIRRVSVLELQAAILGDPIFLPDSAADSHRNQTGPRLLDALNCFGVDIPADDPVTVAGVDEQTAWWDPQVLLQRPSDLLHEVVGDRANHPDRDRIDRHDHSHAGIALHNQSLHIEWVVDRPRLQVGDLDLGSSRPQLSRIGHRKQRADETPAGDPHGEAKAEHGILPVRIRCSTIVIPAGEDCLFQIKSIRSHPARSGGLAAASENLGNQRVTAPFESAAVGIGISSGSSAAIRNTSRQ